MQSVNVKNSGLNAPRIALGCTRMAAITLKEAARIAGIAEATGVTLSREDWCAIYRAAGSRLL
ncbi:MAG: hypothetical protein LBU86_07160 [Oscillospiraceae bacterium]|jgi:predicted oxidoreductase|nr:hypothetical protein [Oscillospiraceae bacterium]